MRNCVSLLLAALVLAGATMPARAGWNEFWAEFDLHRRRVAAWPEPFAVRDREAVRNPFCTMADNGWKQQNTLNSDLFQIETHELNHAGKIKLRQMLTELPPHRRQIYVLEGPTSEATSGRVASVYKNLADIAPDQHSCTVMTTRIPAPSGEGWYLYDVEHSYRTTVPAPRLPASSVGGASGCGGG
jgi:hypothetical protein